MGQAQEPDFSLIPFYYLPLYIHCQSILYKLYSLYNDNTKLSVHDIKGDKGRGRLFYKLDSSVKIITIMQQFYTTYIIFRYEIILLSKIPIIDTGIRIPKFEFRRNYSKNVRIARTGLHQRYQPTHLCPTRVQLLHILTTLAMYELRLLF